MENLDEKARNLQRIMTENAIESLGRRIRNLENEVQLVRDGTLGWETTVKARAYLAASQAIATGTPTKITLDTETYDVGANFNTTLNRFIAPIPGYYLIAGIILWQSPVVDKYYIASMYVNGGQSFRGDSNASSIVSVSSQCSSILHLNKSDYVELYGLHNAGVNKNAIGGTQYTFMSIHLLSKDYEAG